MVKPPKKITVSPTPDSSTPTRPSPETGDAVRFGSDTVDLPVAQSERLLGGSSPSIQPDAVNLHPSVIISTPEADAVVLARPQQIPGATPHEATAQARPDVAVPAPPPRFIDPQLAVRLTLAEHSADGIRYDKHKKSYVDIEGGSVMVRKLADGRYQQTHAGELSPSGVYVEQIPGTRRWREASQAGPFQPHGASKRPRLDDDINVAPDAEVLAEHLYSQPSQALDLSAGQWRNWGRSTLPESAESIAIDGLHYPIVPQNIRANTRLVYLQHPDGLPHEFGAFEHMLRNQPSRQPRWALRVENEWRAVENYLPFDMSPTQYVASAFSQLSDQSVHALAKTVFEQTRPPAMAQGDGLSVMSLTFRHWCDRVNNESPMRRFSDPLLMLPTLVARPDLAAPGGVLSLPPPSADTLQRLDFNPAKFALPWSEYANAPTMAGLRSVFQSVLEHAGYSVYPTPRLLIEGALIFHREGVPAVFVLKLPPVIGNNIPRNALPGIEMNALTFQARLTDAQRQTLNTQLSQHQVVYLIGAMQQLAPQQPTLLIVREG